MLEAGSQRNMPSFAIISKWNLLVSSLEMPVSKFSHPFNPQSYMLTLNLPYLLQLYLLTRDCDPDKNEKKKFFLSW